MVVITFYFLTIEIVANILHRPPLRRLDDTIATKPKIPEM